MGFTDQNKQSIMTTVCQQQSMPIFYIYLQQVFLIYVQPGLM